MNSAKSRGTFGAFVEPHGIYLVEYRKERDGLSIVRQSSDDRRLAGLAEAGERLAQMIRATGATGATLSAAVRGFGSTYQIMMLPPAEPAVLGPVIRRELSRLNPDMETPRVDYVLAGEIERRKRSRPETGRPQQEILVGAVPETAVSAFGDELVAAGVSLEHLTVLPQVMQRLYQQGDGSGQPTACYVELPGGPLIAFFHEGQLRLIVEPPVTRDESPAERAQMLIEHLERGNLYLRQQFRGVELGRVLVATGSPDATALVEDLGARLSYPVEMFPGAAGDTRALIAMGAVLDGDAEKGLNLSPFAESAEAKGQRKERETALLAGGVVSALALLWAIYSVVSLVSLNRKVQAERTTAASRVSAIAPLRVVAEERLKNQVAVNYLQGLATDRQTAQQVLRALVRATPPGVQFTAVSMDRTGSEWTFQVSGSAFGDTGADVLLGIDRFFHALPRELALHDLVLAELDDTAPGEFGAAMKFSVTFVATGTAHP